MRISILALMAGLGATPLFADEVTTWRLFVSDHALPTVTAIDLGTNEVLGQYEIGAPATLYTTDDPSAVFAVQTSANVVNAIATGITVEDHGDHGDVEIGEPALLPVELTGERPVHFVAHDGRIAVFFDGEGIARVVDEKSFLSNEHEVVEFDSGAPHHGVAVPIGDHLLISRPHPDKPEALPVGIEVRAPSGEAVSDLHACPDLHGEAASGRSVALACAEGVLVSTGANPPGIEMVPYGDALGDGKSTTLLGGVAMQYWLGNFGADRVAIIDPSAEEPFRLVPLEVRRVHFAVDPVEVRFAYIFTEDGKLHRLDVVDAEIVASLQVTAPYSMDGEWNLPRPRIAVAGDQIAVTDPLGSAIHLVSTGDFSVTGRIELGGEARPFNVVAVGASGEQH